MALKKLALLVLMITCSSTLVFADDASMQSKVKELLELQNTAQMGETAIEQMSFMMKQRFPDLSDEFINKLNTTVMDEFNRDMVSIYAPSYTNHFSEEEIDELLAFYKSELGQKFVDFLPKMMVETTPAVMELNARVEQKIFQQIQEYQDAQQAE